MATSELYTADTIAKIVIPNVSIMSIDSNREVCFTRFFSFINN